MSEHQRLEDIAADSWYAGWVNAATIRYSGRIFARHWHGGRCLELGPADGQMTGMLLEHFDELVSVEGSATYCDRLREHFSGEPKLEVVCSLFEDYRPGPASTPCSARHILEHVDDPVSVLAAAREWGQAADHAGAERAQHPSAGGGGDGHARATPTRSTT